MEFNLIKQQGLRRCHHDLLTFLALLFLIGTAAAFPPAPYYTLCGMVRDQVGQTVTAEGTEVILLKGGLERTLQPGGLDERHVVLPHRGFR